MSYRKPFGAGRLEAAAEVLLHLPRLGLIIYLDAFSDVIPRDRGRGGKSPEGRKQEKEEEQQQEKEQQQQEEEEKEEKQNEEMEDGR